MKEIFHGKLAKYIFRLEKFRSFIEDGGRIEKSRNAYAYDPKHQNNIHYMRFPLNAKAFLYYLTESLAFGVAFVISRIGNHISAVENDFDLRFSSNDFASRKKVTEPIFL